MRTFLIASICLLLTACEGQSQQTITDQDFDNLQLQPTFGDLHFHRAVLVLQHINRETLWYVLEQYGKIFRVNDKNERELVADLKSDIDLEISCNECGLLGMALHPDFKKNGYIYLSFNEERGDDMVSIVSRFQSPDNGDTIDLASRNDIYEVLQPYGNHNGGHVLFGPDGYLYIGMGDGGAANDPPDHGQNKNTTLGAMLRVNDDGTAAPNNIKGADPRIFAYGLRNPWRYSFDRETNQLWVADVGQYEFEEIDIVTLGKNYGWRCMEGFVKTENECTSDEEFTPPVAVYGRDDGISITGGHVYRGKAIPALQGRYIYGDYGSGRIWALSEENGQYQQKLLLSSELNISSFGEDADGELYVVEHSKEGNIYRLEPKTSVDH